MNEVGAPLTITAVIATIVSVIFAIAAFYVSHRRHKQTSISTSGGSVPSPRSFREQSKPNPRPHIPVSAAQSREVKPMADETPAATATSTPRFKKLSSHGVENPMPGAVDDNNYVWE